MAKIDVLSMNEKELEQMIQTLGEAKYRGKQIFAWLHKNQVTDFSQMSNLSIQLRQKLAENCSISDVKPVKRFVSELDGTIKYLFEVANDDIIESVWMKYKHGNTVCVSTQLGCRMGCQFCASTLQGRKRNLTAGEMLSQVYAMTREEADRVSGVVLMGSGEPLDNYENVMKFIQLLHDPNGMNLGYRHITLSTCGLIGEIKRLREEGLPITLAVSLHASNDKIRNQLMPISKANPMPELLYACKSYGDITKRRVTFEYAMIDGINDSVDCAHELADQLSNMLCHVNIIPMNRIKEKDFRASSQETVEAFAAVLQRRGLETTVRRRLGTDIDGACGQLRHRYLKDMERS